MSGNLGIVLLVALAAGLVGCSFLSPRQREPSEKIRRVYALAANGREAEARALLTATTWGAADADIAAFVLACLDHRVPDGASDDPAWRVLRALWARPLGSESHLTRFREAWIASGRPDLSSSRLLLRSLSNNDVPRTEVDPAPGLSDEDFVRAASTSLFRMVRMKADLFGPHSEPLVLVAPV